MINTDYIRVPYCKSIHGQEEIDAVLRCLSESTQMGKYTRLFENKDHFTIYDFVEAHEHFKDEEWDGPPLDPEINENPGRKKKKKKKPTIIVESDPFDEPVKKMIKVQISDSAVREIDSMIKTTFWDPDGTPISAEKFMQALFGEIPKFFKSEDQLVKIWSDPNTREELLKELPAIEEISRIDQESIMI